MNTIHGFARAGSTTGDMEPIEEGIILEEAVVVQEPTLMDILKKRLANLLSVKSLVTLILTCVFAYMAIAGKISQDFMTVYAVVIAFYFGSQNSTANKENQR